MKITKQLDRAMTDFLKTFRYLPNYPQNMGFNQIEFAKELEKCVEDNFDYTIEKYGTLPSKNLGRPSVIYD